MDAILYSHKYLCPVVSYFQELVSVGVFLAQARAFHVLWTQVDEQALFISLQSATPGK